MYIKLLLARLVFTKYKIGRTTFDFASENGTWNIQCASQSQSQSQSQNQASEFHSLMLTKYSY